METLIVYEGLLLLDTWNNITEWKQMIIIK